MKTLYIPEIGDKIRLLKDWDFTVHNESRNSTVIQAFGLGDYFDKQVVRLPKDSILTVDRIYIRKGVRNFSSITFYLKLPSNDFKIDKTVKRLRFWAKLHDVNKITYERIVPEVENFRWERGFAGVTEPKTGVMYNGYIGRNEVLRITAKFDDHEASSEEISELKGLYGHGYMRYLPEQKKYYYLYDAARMSHHSDSDNYLIGRYKTALEAKNAGSEFLSDM